MDLGAILQSVQHCLKIAIVSRFDRIADSQDCFLTFLSVRPGLSFTT